MENLSECSLVNTEEKWLFSIEALSVSLLYVTGLGMWAQTTLVVMHDIFANFAHACN